MIGAPSRLARLAGRVVLTLSSWVTVSAVTGVVTGCSIPSAAIGGAMLVGLFAVAAFDDGPRVPR